MTIFIGFHSFQSNRYCILSLTPATFINSIKEKLN